MESVVQCVKAAALFFPELCGSSVSVVCFLLLVSWGVLFSTVVQTLSLHKSVLRPTLPCREYWVRPLSAVVRPVISLLSPMCFDDEGHVHLTVDDSGTGHRTGDRNYARLSFIQQLVFTSQRTNSVSAAQTNRLLVCTDSIVVVWERIVRCR
jgi:hypothetical protein